MASTIKIKRSSVAGKIPLTTDLTTGEIAINTKDKKLYSSNGTAVFEIGSRLTNLTVSGNATVSGAMTTSGIVSGLELVSTNASGDEGGEIKLTKPPNGTLDGGITIDAYQNRIRFFEQGGSARGAYINLADCAGGVGTNLLTGGSSSNAFSGILVGSNVVVADSATDRITFVAGSGMTISANPTTDTITFVSTGAGGATWSALLSTNTALRTLISDRLQVANAAATYQTKAVERAALANTNARITLVNQNLTGTNTALRGLISDRLQVANAVATYQTIATERAALANTNARITLVNSNLTGTNTALRTLISDRLQVANASATYETKSDANAKLANTNSRINLVNSNLTGTNTALRGLISDRLQVANAVATYATKSNPSTSGFLDHTGRVSISTNLSVSGNVSVTNIISGRYVPRVNTATSTATLSWNSNSYEQYQLTAMAADTTINADSGTPSNAQKIMFRFKDNGTARTLTWTTGSSKAFRAIGVTLPTTTTINKTTYVGAIYNSADDRWDVIATAQET